MDDGLGRSLTRQVCLAYALDKSVNAQQHLHGHRTCTCLEIGGIDHKCKLTQRRETCRRFGEFERFGEFVASSQNRCTHLSSVRALFSQLFFDPYAEDEKNVSFYLFFSDSSSLEYFRGFDQEDLIKSNSFASQTRLQNSLGSIFHLAPQCHLWPADEAYDGIRNPYVLVINNVNFYFTKDLRPRNGASHDRDNIRTFVEEAGFEKLEEHFDLTKEQMLNLLEKTRLNGDLGEYRLPLRKLPCGVPMGE